MFFGNSAKEENIKLKELLSSLGYSYDEDMELKDIHTYIFPEVVLKRTQDELACSKDELQLVILDFYDYMYTTQKYQHVDMLSKTTDVLWHNLILDTKAYLNFCSEYLGFFVHHIPYIEQKELNEKEMKKIKKKYKISINQQPTYLDYRNTYVNRNQDNVLLNTYLLFGILTLDDNIQNKDESNNSSTSFVDDSSTTTKSFDNYSDSSSSSSSSSCSSSSSSSCGGGGGCGS